MCRLEKDGGRCSYHVNQQIEKVDEEMYYDARQRAFESGMPSDVEATKAEIKRRHEAMQADVAQAESEARAAFEKATTVGGIAAYYRQDFDQQKLTDAESNIAKTIYELYKDHPAKAKTHKTLIGLMESEKGQELIKQEAHFRALSREIAKLDASVEKEKRTLGVMGNIGGVLKNPHLYAAEAAQYMGAMAADVVSAEKYYETANRKIRDIHEQQHERENDFEENSNFTAANRSRIAETQKRIDVLKERREEVYGQAEATCESIREEYREKHGREYSTTNRNLRDPANNIAYKSYGPEVSSSLVFAKAREDFNDSKKTIEAKKKHIKQEENGYKKYLNRVEKAPVPQNEATAFKSYYEKEYLSTKSGKEFLSKRDTLRNESSMTATAIKAEHQKAEQYGGWKTHTGAKLHQNANRRLRTRLERMAQARGYTTEETSQFINADPRIKEETEYRERTGASAGPRSEWPMGRFTGLSPQQRKEKLEATMKSAETFERMKREV